MCLLPIILVINIIITRQVNYLQIKPLQNTKIQNQKKRAESGGGGRLSGIPTNLESQIDPKIGKNK